jgi:hypothetical protein
LHHLVYLVYLISAPSNTPRRLVPVAGAHSTSDDVRVILDDTHSTHYDSCSDHTSSSDATTDDEEDAKKEPEPRKRVPNPVDIWETECRARAGLPGSRAPVVGARHHQTEGLYWDLAGHVVVQDLVSNLKSNCTNPLPQPVGLPVPVCLPPHVPPGPAPKVNPCLPPPFGSRVYRRSGADHTPQVCLLITRCYVLCCLLHPMYLALLHLAITCVPLTVTYHIFCIIHIAACGTHLVFSSCRETCGTSLQAY